MRAFVLTLLLVVAIPFVASAEEIEWDKQTGVEAGKNWTVEFNVPLEDTTENKDFIFVQDENGKVLGNGVSIEGKKAVIYANGLYEEGESYELHITENLAFGNGKTYENHLTMPFSIQGNYFDEELLQGVSKGKLKGVPLSLGSSVTAPDQQFGTDYTMQELLKFKVKQYDEIGFGFEPGAEEEGLKALIKQLPANTYDKNDVVPLLGEASLTPYQESVDQTAAIYFVDQYQVVVTYEGKGTDGAVTAVGLVDY